MRALFFEWPDEPSIWDHPTQYLLGNDLLVAPVLEPGVDRVDVFVPAGEWLDAWSGELLSGPTVVSRPAPIDEMAVLVRGGDTRGLVHMLRTAT
jgi:alpha-glucosidase (family GH31 glycosyl hydrolase)